MRSTDVRHWRVQRYWLGRHWERARAPHDPVASGEFGARMAVSLVNDGPVTFMLRVPHTRASAQVTK